MYGNNKPHCWSGPVSSSERLKEIAQFIQRKRPEGATTSWWSGLNRLSEDAPCRSADCGSPHPRRISARLRVLRRTPVFAAVAILSLALGIGANATIFQLIDTVRFRSLPVANPEGLAEVRADGVNGFGISADFNSAVTYPLWEQIRAHQTAFASMFAWGDAQFLVGRARRGQAGARTVGQWRLLSRRSASHQSGAACSRPTTIAVDAAPERRS